MSLKQQQRMTLDQENGTIMQPTSSLRRNGNILGCRLIKWVYTYKALNTGVSALHDLRARTPPSLL
jgi:hypothetical protein